MPGSHHDTYGDTRLREFAGQPGSGKVPIAAHCAGRNLEDLDDFFFLKAAEIAQFHDSCLSRTDLRKCGEGVIPRRRIECIFMGYHLRSFFYTPAARV